jgi:hypothetical protein
VFQSLLSSLQHLLLPLFFIYPPLNEWDFDRLMGLVCRVRGQ